MKVTIIGVARSGYAAARFALSLGYTVRVTDACCDPHSSTGAVQRRDERVAELRERGVDVELGEHTRAFIENADLVVTSPGVPDHAPPLQWARDADIPVISEIEFAVRHIPSPIVGITGTNGKTTTTALAGHVLHHAGIPAIVAGNIGQPLSGVVENITGDDTIILEISSFQLETVRSFHPHIAVWLNVTPDHLDRYASMEEYIAAKARIFTNMTRDDWAVCWWRERETVMPFIRERGIRPVWIDETGMWRQTPDMPYGAYISDGELYTIFNGVPRSYGRADATMLPGAHNIVNILAVCAVAHILHIPEYTVRDAVQSFHGLRHRLETIAVDGGITYINDSKATNVDALCKAVDALSSPIALIAGGYDKNSDFMHAANAIGEKVCHTVLIGAAAERMEQAWKDFTPTTRAYSMAEAVAVAATHVSEGGTVLLAPGCASYDMYDDFEKRGDDFARCVRKRVDHTNQHDEDSL